MLVNIIIIVENKYYFSNITTFHDSKLRLYQKDYPISFCTCKNLVLTFKIIKNCFATQISSST